MPGRCRCSTFGRRTGSWRSGSGRASRFCELSREARAGYVCGVDHSELMLREASRRNADGIGRGVVDLRLAAIDALPAFDAPFDKILAVNVVLFWSQPDAHLAQLRNLLRPGGLIAVAHQPRGPGATDETSAAKGREIGRRPRARRILARSVRPCASNPRSCAHSA